MKTKFLFVLMLMYIGTLSAQIKLSSTSLEKGVETITFLPDEEKKSNNVKLLAFINGKLDFENMTFEELKNSDSKEIPIDSVQGKLKWTVTDNIVDFKLTTNDATGTIYYCKVNKVFVLDIETECKDKTGTKLNDSDYDNIIQVPIPKIFTNEETRADSHRNRYLIIDASPQVNYKVNNGIYKRKNPKSFDPTNKFDTIFDEASLDVKGTLSVFIRNFSNSELKSVKVRMNGTDYSYTQGLENIFDNLKQSKSTVREGEKGQIPADSISAQSTTNQETLNYLKKAYNIIIKHNAIDINHFKALNIYKNEIEKFKSKLSVEELEYYYKIQSWNPTDLLLTPYASSISDSDEITISIETKNKGEDTTEVTEVGRFRTTGGLSFNIGSNLNFTGLKINEIYTETVDIDGTEELRAKIEDTNQLSLGIGLNAEIGFRTGSIFEPTFNLGFFIPFEEEISPYIGIGPGISLKTGKVRLAFSGGIAFGKVNVLNERYRDIDLTSLNLTNTDLTSNVWDTSWFVGIGINFVELTNNSKD